MPFTLSHPAIVLPLLPYRKYFDTTGLILGSMAPDLEYFLHFRPYHVHGHTLWGQVYFNLPLVFLIACLFHRVIKKPLIQNLPHPFDQRLSHLCKDQWRLKSPCRIVQFTYSAFLGMFTHLFWDGFTHTNGFFVQKISFLQRGFWLMGKHFLLPNLLQHVSTLLGLIILLHFIIKNLPSPVEKPLEREARAKFKSWIQGLLFFLFFYGCLFLLTRDFSLGAILVGAMSCGFLSIFFTALINKSTP